MPDEMTEGSTHQGAVWSFLPHDRVNDLIERLRDEGFRTIGPRIVDQAIVLGDLDHSDSLPRGWLDEQEAGHYRLRRDEDAGWFDFVVGPQSLKPFLLPPRETLFQIDRTPDRQWSVTEPRERDRPLAVIGVRGCDVAALAILDKVFLDGPHRDPRYARRRAELFLVGISCRRAAPTCFCHSMDTGPELRGGCDVELREVAAGFLVRGNTKRGHSIVSALDVEMATAEVVADSNRRTTRLQEEMAGRASRRSRHGAGRWVDRTGLHDRLMQGLDHEHWKSVAERCLACANCTMVCPTCFCTTVDDVSDLHNEHVVRQRRWESCFTTEHSYTVAGPVHPSTASRYRQWLVHKLASWEDQFGTTGCVGCGRCITWCPVGIDVTEEVRYFEARTANG